MRTSQFFAPTLRQVSGEVELASHRLLLRAGYIRQVAAGVYSLLPLGLRVVRKIENIIREEMDAAGAQECFSTPWSCGRRPAGRSTGDLS